MFLCHFPDNEITKFVPNITITGVVLGANTPTPGATSETLISVPNFLREIF